MDVKSVLGIVFEGEKVLLVKRRDVPVWVFPGGGIEENESGEQAVIREIFEESGLKVDIVRRVGTYTGGFFIKPVHLYECRIVGGQLHSGEEVSGARFFPITELPKAIPPPFQEFLEDALKHVPSFEREITSITIPKICITFLKHPILFFRFLLSRIGLHVNSRE